jgi:hypothetical protein
MHIRTLIPLLHWVLKWYGGIITVSMVKALYQNLRAINYRMGKKKLMLY